ncbi:MAG: hypothetical protein LC130_29585 [Bryobacterales bacterium]|nr:hypothetical protein [Bryobacterales bacterium]
MSRYTVRPLDLDSLRTVSLRARGGKVHAADFARPYRKAEGLAGFLDGLPHILAGDSVRAVIAAIQDAREHGKPVIWALGGHVIKCGLAPVLIELMSRRYCTALAMNGAAAIHDFEIALAGHTSEEVEAVLPDGAFGSAEETGREMNRALTAGEGIGAGEALGRALDGLADPQFADKSLLLQAWRRSVPVTVHIAIGTDTPHTHPAVDPGALGRSTHHDFRLFCSLVSALNEGGVYINCGSAVIMPEVFLKAVSAVRNLGIPLAEFTTVNLDFLQHYRPRVNVVERPHITAGGHGYSLTGHHELMLPLIAAALIEQDA